LQREKDSKKPCLVNHTDYKMRYVRSIEFNDVSTYMGSIQTKTERLSSISIQYDDFAEYS